MTDTTPPRPMAEIAHDALLTLIAQRRKEVTLLFYDWSRRMGRKDLAYYLEMIDEWYGELEQAIHRGPQDGSSFDTQPIALNQEGEE